MKRNHSFLNLLFSAACSSLLLTILVISASAQNIRNTDYSPDKALKSNARVNPSTLAMELSIPLGGYAGRAGNGLPISIDYSSKVWEMKNIGLWQSFSGSTLTGVMPLYAKRSAGGWNSSLGTPRIDYKYDIYQGNNQDVAYEGQTYSPAPWENPADEDLFYIKRLHVQMPDGSTHELRASDLPFDCGSINSGCTPDLTGIFLSVDGSRMRLESGSSSSTLFLPDGSRYIFGAPSSGPIGTPAHTFYDRNGNKMTFDTSTRTWTDTMGRTITDPIAFNWDGTQNQSAAVDGVTHFPGFGTANYDVKFSWSYLKDPGSGANALDDPNATLNNLSNMYCEGNLEHTATGPHLFSNLEAPVRVCGSGFDTQGPPFNPIVLTKVKLPNGQFYEFKYNVYGEITKIIYPTGAYERFIYAIIDPVSVGSPSYDQTNRGVVDRYVSEKGDGSDEVHWSYSETRGTGPSPSPYVVTVNAPDGSKSEQYIADEPDSGVWRPYGFGNEKTGRSYEDRVYDNSTNHYLLQRKLTAYEVTEVQTGQYIPYSNLIATRDIRPTREISITFDPVSSYALATMSETAYDTTGSTDAAYFSSLNAKQSKVYNYVVISSTTAASANITTAAAWFSGSDLAKTSEIDYLYDSNYKARNINGLATETRIKDASGTVKAKSQVTYDESGYTVTSSGTMPSAASGSWVDPTDSGQFGATIGTKRGLPTTVRSFYDLANNYYIDTHSYFDQYGNLRKSRDGRGNDAETLFDDDYAFAYPTLVKTPVPDSTGTNGANSELQTSTAYDYKTGLPTSTTDANGQTTSISYVDPDTSDLEPLLRVRKITDPAGAQTITSYGDGNSPSTRWVKVKSQIDETNWKEGYSWFDGLGRTYKTQKVDTAGDVFTLTCFDTMGRVSKATNPFRNVSSPTCSTTTGLEWTTSTFDTAGRPWKVTTADGAVVQTDYSLATTGSQIGTVVAVTDQAGKLRRSVTNALGQLTRVDEPDNSGTTGSLGNIDTPTQSTVYSYDTLNNLTTVLQASSTAPQCGGASTCSQTRTFSYDSLSRLKSATNPESGTITYAYDPNGNLTQKDDARGVRTTYVYDALNRVTNRNYSTPNGTPGTGVLANYQATPDVTYFYDNITNAKGKLIKVSSSVSTTEYTSFDILGRVTASKQTTDGVTYGNGSTDSPMTYTYNLSGAMIEQQYPSGRVVKNVLDANGDLSIVESRKNASSGYWHYADSFSYNPAGAVTSMQLGNGKWESTLFNSRLQPTQIALGTVQNGTDKLKLDYSYGDWNGSSIDTTKNNGNIVQQVITVPTVGGNNGFTATQKYSYDSLNRIDDSSETISSTQTWRQDFTYDRYGNRNFNQTNTTMPDSFANPAVTNPTLSTTNNRITSSGYNYDSSGNMTFDAALRKFTYDAENKETKVESTNSSQTVLGTVGEYFYDGDGKRVKKYVPSSGETTIFVYDAAGKQIAEYSTIVADTSTAKVNYLTTDHLSSPRINTDANGTVISRHDYHPFGEEISVGRVSHTEYTTDTVRKQFTSYERDNESGLDYAVARYFGSSHGRFTSPDPALSSGREALPQSWNRYVYALNNPLRFTDPLGLYEFDSSVDSTQQDNFRKQLKEANDRLKRIKKTYGKNSDEYKQAKAAVDSYGCEAGTKGCSEKVGSSQVIIKAGKLDPGVGATAARNSTDTKVEVTLDAAKLSKGADLVADIAHEGVHVQDHLNYINSGGKTKVSDYNTEFRGYLVTSVMDEAYPASSSSRPMGGVSYTLYDEKWKTANPKLSAVENVRNERKAAIDKLLAVPKSQGGLYELTPVNPGNSYFP